MDYNIVYLNESQMNEIETQLDEFDQKHIPYKMEGNISIGIEHNGQIIAGLNACITAFRILYVSTVFVQEDFRRKGLGRAMMSAMECEAEKMGVDIIRLDTFDYQGVNFYKSLDYKIVGHYTNKTDNFEEFFFIKYLPQIKKSSAGALDSENASHSP